MKKSNLINSQPEGKGERGRGEFLSGKFKRSWKSFHMKKIFSFSDLKSDIHTCLLKAQFPGLIVKTDLT
jgi:hypothetical protein